MPTVEEYESAGLLTGIVTSRDDRVALLDWLAEEGFSVAEMTAAHGAGQLDALATDRVLLAGNRRTAEELAASVGIDVDTLTLLVRAIGINAGTVPFTDAYAPLLREFGLATQLFSEAEILHFTRVVGSSIARIAEAANALFLIDVEAPMKAAARSELELARLSRAAVESLATVADSLGPLLLVHLHDAANRSRAARRGKVDPDLVRMAIGFVDLVGFTPLSADRSTRDLLDLLVQFESHAYDLVTEHGGRVVKLIGDEVMFATVTPADACLIAQRMFDELAERTNVAPRGGVAYGEVLSHGGDYYGPIVNLASRVADIAVPREILLTTEVAREVPDGFRAVAAGRRMLKGFTDPVPLFSLERLG